MSSSIVRGIIGLLLGIPGYILLAIAKPLPKLSDSNAFLQLVFTYTKWIFAFITFGLSALMGGLVGETFKIPNCVFADTLNEDQSNQCGQDVKRMISLVLGSVGFVLWIFFLIVMCAMAAYTSFYIVRICLNRSTMLGQIDEAKETCALQKLNHLILKSCHQHPTLIILMAIAVFVSFLLFASIIGQISMDAIDSVLFYLNPSIKGA